MREPAIPDAPPGPWGKLAGKVRRSPRTLHHLLAPKIRRRRESIRRLIQLRKFAQTQSSLRRQNPDGQGLVLNTRLVEATIPNISHWADWSLTRYGFHGKRSKQPEIVYVKAVPECLTLFLDRYLPLIKERSRFVLITGDADTTLPRQVDQRFPDYARSGLQQRLLDLLKDPRLLHWYVENLDTPMKGVTPIPLGWINSDGHGIYQQCLREEEPIAIREKPLKAFCAHHVREGPQWEKRKLVTRLARESWGGFVDFHDEVPYHEFFSYLKNYPFVICVGGGGLDPSPKAWAALLAGAIPIMERNPTTLGYEGLPVAYVDRWEPGSLDPGRLEGWLEQWHPWYEDPVRRREVLEKMSMTHWLRRIRSHHRGA